MNQCNDAKAGIEEDLADSRDTQADLEADVERLKNNFESSSLALSACNGAKDECEIELNLVRGNEILLTNKISEIKTELNLTGRALEESRSRNPAFARK